MGDAYSENFDLPMLMRLDELDIRAVAAKNMSLQVGQYFDLLTKFIIHEPEITEALTRITALDGDENAFRTLADTRTLFEYMGCKKFAQAFSEIVDAGRINDKRFAAACAKKISGDFSGFYKRILATKKETEEIPSSIPDSNDLTYEEPNVSFEMHSLHKLLKMMDHEESTRKLRILAIDDAPVMMKTISAVLSDEYKVYLMSDPMKLEKFLTQITPELFLLDYQMPELNGFDLVPIIRGFKEHKDTPIIFITSLGTTDHVSAALTLGACDFIVKPFQGNILREKIAKHIVRKRLV